MVGNCTDAVNCTADFTQQDVFGTVSLGETFGLSQTDIEILDVLGWAPSGTGTASSATVATGTAGSAGSTAMSTPMVGFTYPANNDAAPVDIAPLGSYIASMFPTSSTDQGSTPITGSDKALYEAPPLAHS